jgi:pimeloyl-ACP methyl ester carboxylesterase
MRSITHAIAFLLLSLLLAAAPATQPANPAGHWEGAVALPGAPLNVKIDLTLLALAWKGTIDIPQQNATGLALDPITVAGDAVRFTIAGVPGDPTFDGKIAGDSITGTFTQGPLSLPFSLTRGTAAMLPVVAQKPSPASTQSYTEQEVSYSNGPIHLAATLTLPQGPGPFPAVILITGSGPQNRDEELFGHKPFKLIADSLASAGIAVLRADDRGVGQSTGGSVEEATTVELAGDTLAGIDFLKTRLEISRDRIGLIGHSEGAIIAPMLAARSKDVAFIVMLAGTGLPGDQVWLKQREMIDRSSGVDEALVQAKNKDAPVLISAIETGAGFPAIDALVRAQFDSQSQLIPPDHRPTTQQTQDNATLMTAAMTTRWFRFFLTYDPRPCLRQVTVPVLVMNGDLDRQVSPDQNLPEIEKALKEAGNSDVEIRRMPGLNHLFQKAQTGSPSEYATLSDSFDAGAIDVIRDWIVRRFVSTAPTTQAR